MTAKKWLVRISAKYNIGAFEHYIEVNATDEYYARHQALQGFEQLFLEDHALRQQLALHQLSLKDICAGDSVEID